MNNSNNVTFYFTTSIKINTSARQYQFAEELLFLGGDNGHP